MENLTKKFEIIQSEIAKQSEQLNTRVNDASEEIKRLEDKFQYVKRINEKQLMNSSGENRKKVENDIKFNQYLYDLELRKKMCKKMYYKNEIQAREMYVIRCIIYMNLMLANQNKNEISKTQNFFALINHIYEEFIKQHQYLKDYYREKKDIHESYVLLLTLFPNLDKERKEQIELNLLTEEEYQELLNKILNLDTTLEEYKGLFKTIKVSKKYIKDSCLNYDIKKVVEGIYQGVKTNEGRNKKQKI